MIDPVKLRSVADTAAAFEERHGDPGLIGPAPKVLSGSAKRRARRRKLRAIARRTRTIHRRIET